MFVLGPFAIVGILAGALLMGALYIVAFVLVVLFHLMMAGYHAVMQHRRKNSGKFNASGADEWHRRQPEMFANGKTDFAVWSHWVDSAMDSGRPKRTTHRRHYKSNRAR